MLKIDFISTSYQLQFVDKTETILEILIEKRLFLNYVL